MEGEEMAAKARTEGHAIHMYLSQYPHGIDLTSNALGHYGIVSLCPSSGL